MIAKRKGVPREFREYAKLLALGKAWRALLDLHKGINGKATETSIFITEISIFRGTRPASEYPERRQHNILQVMYHYPDIHIYIYLPTSIDRFLLVLIR